MVAKNGLLNPTPAVEGEQVRLEQLRLEVTTGRKKKKKKKRLFLFINQVDCDFHTDLHNINLRRQITERVCV